MLTVIYVLESKACCDFYNLQIHYVIFNLIVCTWLKFKVKCKRWCTLFTEMYVIFRRWTKVGKFWLRIAKWIASVSHLYVYHMTCSSATIVSLLQCFTGHWGMSHSQCWPSNIPAVSQFLNVTQWDTLQSSLTQAMFVVWTNQDNYLKKLRVSIILNLNK